MSEVEQTDTCVMCGLLIEGEGSGVALIAAERQRQIDKEGFDEASDAGRTKGELADAAGCYCAFAAMQSTLLSGDFPENYASIVPPAWPFESGWWKVDKEDDTRALVKAGALIAAEIDRRLAAGHP